ncbi:MAG: AAA family ATPase [Eubacteriales bacterium]
MRYIDYFKLASENDEAGYILSYPAKLEMRCYSDNVYPFKIFPYKRLGRLDFEQITILYGGNGSGKSTLLNIIAQKLALRRGAPFNNTPFLDEYIKLCECGFTYGKNAPKGSRIITSDDVFDFLLDIRAINEGVERRREQLFDDYNEMSDPMRPTFQMKSLDDYDELKLHNEVRHSTKSAFTTRRLPQELSGKSNGESAYSFFTNEIKENALYLLDEPENSLSPKLQLDLASFISDSARFYGCQFLISTHSPFFLSLNGARVYDLDSVPVVTKRWTELENVLIYHDFFENNREKF